MTLAELKRRIQVGTQLKRCYSWMWQDPGHEDFRTNAERYGNRNFHAIPPAAGFQLCTVTKVQGNGFYFTIEGDPKPPRGSGYWFDFPKARDLTADERGFEYRADERFKERAGFTVARYEWL